MLKKVAVALSLLLVPLATEAAEPNGLLAPGKRILFLGDQSSHSLDPEKKFRIAFNSFDLASGGRRWNRLKEIADLPASQLKEYDFQTRDAVIEYIRKHSPIKPELNGWWKTETKARTP